LISWIGEISRQQKAALFANAFAVVAFPQWEEPFGMINIEAASAGTPVITSPKGGIPEIVIDGKTGLLVDSPEQACSRINEIESLSSIQIRDHFLANFTSELMAKRYIEIFDRATK
jgi:glycosyltransferase involved in cell wall biosynthesis